MQCCKSRVFCRPRWKFYVLHTAGELLSTGVGDVILKLPFPRILSALWKWWKPGRAENGSCCFLQGSKLFGMTYVWTELERRRVESHRSRVCPDMNSLSRLHFQWREIGISSIGFLLLLQNTRQPMQIMMFSWEPIKIKLYSGGMNISNIIHYSHYALVEMHSGKNTQINPQYCICIG